MGETACLRPLSTVIVHPEGGGLAANMKGMARDLAQHGYLAVAVDDRRQLHAETCRKPNSHNSANVDLQGALPIGRQCAGHLPLAPESS